MQYRHGLSVRALQHCEIAWLLQARPNAICHIHISRLSHSTKGLMKCDLNLTRWLWIMSSSSGRSFHEVADDLMFYAYKLFTTVTGEYLTRTGDHALGRSSS